MILKSKLSDKTLRILHKYHISTTHKQLQSSEASCKPEHTVKHPATARQRERNPKRTAPTRCELHSSVRPHCHTVLLMWCSCDAKACYVNYVPTLGKWEDKEQMENLLRCLGDPLPLTLCLLVHCRSPLKELTNLPERSQHKRLLLHKILFCTDVSFFVQNRLGQRSRQQWVVIVVWLCGCTILCTV